MELPFSNLMSASGLLVISIFVAVSGGKIAAHKTLSTRLLTLRGGPAVVLGLVLLVAGIGGAAYSWYVGLRFAG